MQPVTPKEEVILQVFHQILTRLEQLQPQGHKIRELECYFCSETGHGIQECPQVEPTIRAGKCTRNANGRIVLPIGARIPNNIPGNNLREKIEEYYRRSASRANCNENIGSFFYETRSTRAPSATTAAFNHDKQLHFRKQLRKLGAHNVPAPTSTATPFKPLHFHEPNVAAPVSPFHMSITPWPAPTESKTTPVKLTHASNTFNSINYPNYRPTTFAATIRPPPDSKTSRQQTATSRTPSIDSACPIKLGTLVPATPVLSPVKPSPPSPSVTSHLTAVIKPTQFSPSSASSTSPEPTPIRRTPASTRLASSSSFERTPVSSPLSIPVSPLLAPAVSSKENATETPTQPRRLEQTPTTSIIATATAAHATSTAPTPCRLPSVERAATTTTTPTHRTPRTTTGAITPESATKNAAAASKLKTTVPVAEPAASPQFQIRRPAYRKPVAPRTATTVTAVPSPAPRGTSIAKPTTPTTSTAAQYKLEELTTTPVPTPATTATTTVRTPAPAPANAVHSIAVPEPAASRTTEPAVQPAASVVSQVRQPTAPAIFTAAPSITMPTEPAPCTTMAATAHTPLGPAPTPPRLHARFIATKLTKTAARHADEPVEQARRTTAAADARVIAVSMAKPTRGTATTVTAVPSPTSHGTSIATPTTPTPSILTAWAAPFERQRRFVQAPSSILNPVTPETTTVARPLDKFTESAAVATVKGTAARTPAFAADEPTKPAWRMTPSKPAAVERANAAAFKPAACKFEPAPCTTAPTTPSTRTAPSAARTTLIIAPAPDVSAGKPYRLPPAESKTTPATPTKSNAASESAITRATAAVATVGPLTRGFPLRTPTQPLPLASATSTAHASKPAHLTEENVVMAPTPVIPAAQCPIECATTAPPARTPA
ncbi:hypothetical protein H0H81_004774, partial [Sphagnurus paluster]